MNKSCITAREFPVIVLYWLTFNEMIGATQFDQVDKRINEANFPSSGSGKKEMPVYAIEIDLQAYDLEMITTRAVLQFLDDFGYKPAAIEELCAFSEQHTEALLNAPVIALGSSFKDSTAKEFFPAFKFNEEAELPDLDLEYSYEDGWPLESVYFLAVKK